LKRTIQQGQSKERQAHQYRRRSKKEKSGFSLFLLQRLPDAKMAGKKNAKAKADQNSLTERTKAKYAEMTAQNLESAQSSSGGRKEKMSDKYAKEANPDVDDSGLRKTRKMADNHAKEARDRGHGRSRPGLVRDTRRTDITAQEVVYTHTHMTDSNRSNGSLRTGEWSCVTVQDDRTKRIHADPVPDMDPDLDPDPGPQQHLTDTQGDGNGGVVIALSGRPGKNGDFPQFDGTSLGYHRFR
jgi:hypothetical protein